MMIGDSMLLFMNPCIDLAKYRTIACMYKVKTLMCTYLHVGGYLKVIKHSYHAKGRDSVLFLFLYKHSYHV